MKFRYVVKRFCDIKQKRPKILHEPGMEIETYCAIAAALNLGIVNTKEFSFNSPEEYQFVDWTQSYSLCIVREKLHE